MAIYDSWKNKELLLAIQQGDKSAFEFLFKKYYEALVGYITTYTQDSQLSEDIVQHSFISLWNKRHKLLLDTSPKNYLYTIAYNRYIDLYRKKKREDTLLKELCLENLRKEVLYLSKLRGLDYNEIAEKLKISPRTVEEQVRIAFKKIRKGFNDSQILFISMMKCLR